jgi:tetratricopeptide (TPR) repeat protein
LPTLFLGWLPCLAADNLAKATSLYEKGQYTEALEFIENELRENPKNAAAHYLLGNVLVTRKAYPEAIREYQCAVTLDPTGPSGLYSKQALTGLEAQSKAQSPAPPEGKDKDKDQGKDKASDDSQDDALKHSVKTTSQQTTESSRAMEEECEHKVEEIKRDANARVRLLEEEMRSQIAATGGLRTRYYDPEPIVAPIRQEYNLRIQAVRDDAERRSAEVKADYKQRALSIEQAGLNVDKAYTDAGKMGGIRLSPMGTNLHVRNYESTDEVSGQAATLVAEPGKLGADARNDKNSKILGAGKAQKTINTDKTAK